ncbi:MAG: hypothetical protein IKH52_05345, partial [Bacteroidaceae bacterium]|nr:hypothetical protein [Bacteroidaceae bacterium]
MRTRKGPIVFPKGRVVCVAYGARASRPRRLCEWLDARAKAYIMWLRFAVPIEGAAKRLQACLAYAP